MTPKRRQPGSSTWLGGAGLSVLVAVAAAGCGNEVMDGSPPAGCQVGSTYYESGATFSAADDCNTCTCSNGTVTCTVYPCPCPDCIPCSDGYGETYQVGEQWCGEGGFGDVCTCLSGGVVACDGWDEQCHTEGPPPDDECQDMPYDPEIDCCEPYGQWGLLHPDGSSWTDETSPCSECSCSLSVITCTTPEGLGCDDCFVMTQSIYLAVGEQTPSCNGCDVCTCEPGQVLLCSTNETCETLVDCAGGCEPDGHPRGTGESWVDPTDPAALCYCSSGEVSCSASAPEG